MRLSWLPIWLGVASLTEARAPGQAGGKLGDDAWTSAFPVEKGELVSAGRNPFFILEPGYELVLEKGEERLTITVLDETRVVDGIETRVVEERETDEGEVQEVSRNFFAISSRTSGVFYFGEEVDMYEGGKLVNHHGAWLAGEKGARFGLIMPGQALLGARYYQELAPGEAMDRAEIVGVSESMSTPAGEFKDCLKTEETSPLEPKSREHKVYAPGVGLLQDGSLKLVRYGKTSKAK
jgi:hypothetical protein